MDLAALSNDPSGDLNPELTTSINMQGRGHVARTAKAAGVRRYMLASSCSVYGLGEGTALDEDAPLNPLTEYARSSLGAERATFALADDRFSVTALRNATVFGLSPRMRFDLVVNIMTKNATEIGKLTVTGGGEQWRPLVHVRDVAQAFLTILGAPVEKVNGQAFNIGRANYRVREIAEEVRANLPVPVEIVVTPDAADKRSYNVSFERAKRVLGFEASRDIGFAVREIYDAIVNGKVDIGLKTVTVQWYRHLLEAEQLVDSLRINGRIL
jgi:nucleoside-diphosphate-sugar epimerase